VQGLLNVNEKVHREKLQTIKRRVT